MKAKVRIWEQWFQGTVLNETDAVIEVPRGIDMGIRLTPELVFIQGYERACLTAGDVDANGRTIYDGDTLCHKISKQLVDVKVKPVTENRLNITFQSFSDYEVL